MAVKLVIYMHLGADGQGCRDLDWEGEHVYHFQSRWAYNLIYEDSAQAELQPEERRVLEPVGEMGDCTDPRDPALVKAALVKLYCVLGPEVRRQGQANTEDVWRLAAMQQELGAAVLMCEYALHLGVPVYVTTW
ncbi:MAG: hypothetical protein RhofKO_26180 [Rhodothermales bacterium]